MDKDSKADASGQHTILYGHNMKNGSMFHELVQYKKADFFNAHPMIYYDTPQGRITLRVIAAYAADATEAYNFIFSDLDSLHSFVAKAIKRSPVKLEDVNANAVDKIFSLQTCSYETDNSRTYVLAVPVEE
ncbi:MAG: sortase domain-bontaining protein [Christensenellales bacterium]